jgi:hypothetical protein
VIFRIYYEQRGNHVHMRVFCGVHDGAMAKAGDLCMRAEEFETFRTTSPNFQFRPEQP